MAPPLEDDDFLPEILLRLSRRTYDPARLVRVSAVCKAWRRVLADPSFSGRYRGLHGTRAPVLGVLHNPTDCELDRFVPTATSSSFRPYAHASFYSLDTGEAASGGWTTSASTSAPSWSLEGYYLEDDRPASHVVGDSLYFVGKSGVLLRYRYGRLLVIDSDVLSVIQPPPDAKRRLRLGYTVVMASPENELWMGILHRHMLSLWAREEEDDAAAAANAGWVRRSVIDLKPVLPWPIGKPKGKERACLAVVDEDPDVIFVGTEEDDGVFAVELESLARCASGKYTRLANQEAVCFPS